ncbi:hypothetical protein HYV86_03795 [Candidatus Woesearchaeota archaeon]|nr:hypothetical protein [Candidatus Woesearchaeota archaeon]
MKNLKGLLLLLSFLLIAIQIIQLSVVFSITGAVTGGTATVGLCYNHQPSFYNLTNYTLPHNVAFNSTIYANESDSDAVAFFDNTSLFLINNNTGVFSFIPSILNVGNHSIDITIRDYNSSCASNVSEILLLTINNSIPYQNRTIPNQTWEEDVTLTGINLTTYFADYENDTLNFTAQIGHNITVTISNFTVTIVPNTDYYGITWIVFRANDSLGTATSNNVTLNITDVADFCGDAVCNADESCSSCSADCGSCGGSGSSGGGGGRGSGGAASPRVIEVIPPTPPQTECNPSKKCGNWEPASCTTQPQERSCIEIKPSCTAIKTIETRSCNCIPDWQCSTWVPEQCNAYQTQHRTCVDRNDCNKEPYPDDSQSCASESTYADSQEALIGQAMWSNLKNKIGSLTRTTPLLLTIVIIFCGIGGLWIWHQHKPKIAFWKCVDTKEIDTSKFISKFTKEQLIEITSEQEIKIDTYVEATRNNKVKIHIQARIKDHKNNKTSIQRVE